MGTGQRAPTGPARAGGGRLGSGTFDSMSDCRIVGDPVAAEANHDPVLEPMRSACRVALWRGYVTARFYVWTDGGALVESEPFRAVRAGPPHNGDAARSAHDGLVARLQAAGWVCVEDGDPWWASSLERVDRAAQRRTDGSSADEVSVSATRGQAESLDATSPMSSEPYDDGQARTVSRRPGMVTAGPSITR